MRLSPGISREQALFVAGIWAETDPAGGIRIKADAAHKLPNPVLYRRQEALACWQAVTAPVLVVAGADTDFTSDLKPWIEPLPEDRPFRVSESLSIANAGHMVHFDQPAVLAEAIEDFLAGTRAESGKSLVNSSSTV
jgi:pimeloyl-ACP methyl ester carboxylesterase